MSNSPDVPPASPQRAHETRARHTLTPPPPQNFISSTALVEQRPAALKDPQAAAVKQQLFLFSLCVKCQVGRLVAQRVARARARAGGREEYA